MCFFYIRRAVSEWRRFYVDAALYFCDRLKVITCEEFVNVKIVGAQLSDSGSSNGTCLTDSYHTIIKVLKNEYSEVTT
jgi:hypothetical protein